MRIEIHAEQKRIEEEEEEETDEDKGQPFSPPHSLPNLRKELTIENSESFC